MSSCLPRLTCARGHHLTAPTVSETRGEVRAAANIRSPTHKDTGSEKCACRGGCGTFEWAAGVAASAQRLSIDRRRRPPGHPRTARGIRVCGDSGRSSPPVHAHAIPQSLKEPRCTSPRVPRPRVFCAPAHRGALTLSCLARLNFHGTADQGKHDHASSSTVRPSSVSMILPSELADSPRQFALDTGALRECG